MLTPRPLLDAAYFVPRQTSFPASFIAEVQTRVAGAYRAEFLVFTKWRADSPWLVTEDSGLDLPTGVPPHLAAPVADHDGFDRKPSVRQRARARTVATRFAALWQQAKDTGAIPTNSAFDLTGPTGVRVTQLADFKQDAIQVNGLLGHYEFSARSSDPLIQVSLAGGYDLACQPIHETVTYRPTPGHLIAQDPQQRNWGPSLSPGAYRQVIDHDTWQTCFLIPPNVQQGIGVLDQAHGGTLSQGVR